MKLDKLLAVDPFDMDDIEKENLFLELLNDKHSFHFKNCYEYSEISKRIFNNINYKVEKIEEMPFLPVSIFKNYNLKSILDSEIYKILTSSGTTGQAVSKIFLDRETAALQTRVLTKILNKVIGQKRLPMLIVDSKSVLKNRSQFSARGAGILGLSVFGKDHQYLLDDNFSINEQILIEFKRKYDGEEVLIFGFTYMIWQYLISSNVSIDLSNAILLHSGGWKKMLEISVDNETFKSRLKNKFNLTRVYNFYGMVEQVGSVFLEDSTGDLHCPIFADIIIRNPLDLTVVKDGEVGLIQTLSVLPKSYPGHSLLTEDLGVITGRNVDVNGWKGKSFKILGRTKKAELRGCSDTFKQ